MDYEKQVKDLVKYYQDLLIVQYHDKPKAKAMIKSKIEETLCNLLEVKVRDAFDVDTAVGVQLDIIGKWVGIERIFKGQKYDNQAWFSLPRYNQETSAFMHGFSTYATFEEEGGFLTYDFILGTKNKLNDNDFRMLIKLKIIRNNVPHSPKPIDDAMYKLFADTLYTVWNEMVYNSNAFTVVGSPTIVDGVASGFSSTSYIQPNYQLDMSVAETWELNFKIIMPSQSTTTKSIYASKASGSIKEDNLCIYNGRIQFNIGLNDGTKASGTTSTFFEEGKEVYIKLKFTGERYELFTSQNGVSWSLEKYHASNIKGLNRVRYMGVTTIPSYVYPLTDGSIDLKQFSITVDGKEVFNGGYNQPMEMTFYYNPKRYGIVKLGQEKNCFPIPTGVKANFVEVKK